MYFRELEALYNTRRRARSVNSSYTSNQQGHIVLKEPAVQSWYQSERWLSRLGLILMQPLLFGQEKRTSKSVC